MDWHLLISTVIESVYLLFMYCIFKTEYTFSGAPGEKAVQSWCRAFVHDTGIYENKVCMFGRIVAGLATCWWILRCFLMMKHPEYKWAILWGTVSFDCIGLFLAYMMNLNAFVYVLPLIFIELYIIDKINIIEIAALNKQD